MRACSSSAALPPTVAVLIVSVRSIAKPSGVVAAARQRVGHQVEFVIASIPEAVLREHATARFDVAPRALDGDDLAAGACDLR